MADGPTADGDVLVLATVARPVATFRAPAASPVAP
jgi:hypothetical protein